MFTWQVDPMNLGSKVPYIVQLYMYVGLGISQTLFGSILCFEQIHLDKLK